MPILTKTALRLATIAVALSAPPTAATVALAQGGAPMLGLTLRPGTGPDGEIAHVDVTMSLSGIEAGPANPLVALDLVASNVETIAESVVSVEAVDGQGPLRLVARAAGSGNDAARAWYPERAIVEAVTSR